MSEKQQVNGEIEKKMKEVEKFRQKSEGFSKVTTEVLLQQYKNTFSVPLSKDFLTHTLEEKIRHFFDIADSVNKELKNIQGVIEDLTKEVSFLCKVFYGNEEK